MSIQEELIASYDSAVIGAVEALDQVHTALANLQAVKHQIGTLVSELGMTDSVGRDGPGKNLAKVVEASVIVSVENVASIDGHVKTARTLILGVSPDLAKLQAAGLNVSNWNI